MDKVVDDITRILVLEKRFDLGCPEDIWLDNGVKEYLEKNNVLINSILEADIRNKVSRYNLVQRNKEIKRLCHKYYARFKKMGFTKAKENQVKALGVEFEEQLYGNLLKTVVGYCNLRLSVGAPKKEKRKPLAKSIRIEILRRDDNRCQECGRTASQTPLEIHHITPVAKGGTDSMSNLITLCKACNLSISDRQYAFK